MIVSYRYWNKIRNCGDAITAYILRDVMGLTPVSVLSKHRHMLATGSIFFMANARSIIWGSGMMHPEVELGALPTDAIRALRGRLSLEAIRAMRPDLPDVPLGDPGVLVDYLLDDPAFRDLPIRYRAAVIPHQRSMDRETWPQAAGETILVDMRDASLAPLRAIQQSEVVISQSLHGLIFASALGKPYVWISARADERWAFKFQDWFSTVDNPQPEALPHDLPLEVLIAAAAPRPHRIDRAALLAAFPKAEVCTPFDRPILDFESCRALPVAVIRCDWIDDLARPDHATLDAASRDQLARKLRSKVRAYFHSWAEQPYTMLVPLGLEMPRIDLEDLARFMDRNAQFGLAAVIPDATRARAVGLMPDLRLGNDRLTVFRGALHSGAALLLRPGANLSADREAVTIAPNRT